MSGDGMPVIKSSHSLVAKYVTGPIWEKLSKIKTKVLCFEIASYWFVFVLTLSFIRQITGR
jgi:hypothetical protein